MRTFLMSICFLIVMQVIGQDEMASSSGIKSEAGISAQIFKMGASLQLYPTNRHYYYDSYIGYEQDYQEDRLRGSFFVSYEIIGAIDNTMMAYSIEPKVGLLLKDNSNGAIVGSEFKFYWLNLPYYRMGMAIYAGYTYARGEESGYISLDDGMYMRRYDYRMSMHSFDADLALIPFHFRIKNSPISIEGQLSLLGLSVVRFIPDGRDLPDEVTDHFQRSDAYPYFPKVGLKIGYIIK